MRIDRLLLRGTCIGAIMTAAMTPAVKCNTDPIGVHQSAHAVHSREEKQRACFDEMDAVMERKQ